jgi:hypothetical protein
MSILDTFKNLFRKSAPELDPPKSEPKSSKPIKPRKLPSPPIMKNPKVQGIVKKHSGFESLKKISIEIGKQSEAIAAKWDAQAHHVKQEMQEWADEMCCQVPGHKERDGKLYAIKGNWALQKGLMTEGTGVVDLDDKSLFEDKGCICCFRYKLGLRDLPYSMLTEKGKQTLLGSRLTDGQKKFCKVYLGTGNAVAAYILAYGSGSEPDTIKRYAQEELNIGLIQVWIEKMRREGIRSELSKRDLVVEFIKKNKAQLIEWKYLELLELRQEIEPVLDELVAENLIGHHGERFYNIAIKPDTDNACS